VVEQADRAKNDFVARNIHEIRTPIRAISNMTEFILYDTGTHYSCDMCWDNSSRMKIKSYKTQLCMKLQKLCLIFT
jgi:signal transduction histidine kinase